MLDADHPNHHPFVVLYDPCDQEVEVDERIAFLVERLWRAGVVTAGSCQGGCGLWPPNDMSPAGISFEPEHADVAANLLADQPGLVMGTYYAHFTTFVRCPDFDQELRDYERFLAERREELEAGLIDHMPIRTLKYRDEWRTPRIGA